MRDGEGKIVGASKIARDITERKRWQEQQRLLLREMSHRVKNLFAVASGLVTLSSRSARTPQDMADAVRAGLAALTRAHELTRPGLIGESQAEAQATTLHALIRSIFAPYMNGATGHHNLLLSGPDVPVGGGAVTNLALLLHELATNAAKYGALSAADGVVQIDGVLQDARLSITWTERGGPRIEAEPGSEGFGGMLARQLVATHFGGELARDWQRDGLQVRLAIPMDRLGN